MRARRGDAEGIGADPRDGALNVGSIAKRKIVRAAVSGAASDFAAGEASGLGEVLGLKVEPARSPLWAVSNVKAGAGVAARSTLQAFALTSGAPRVSVAIEEQKHLLNGLVIVDGVLLVCDARGIRAHDGEGAAPRPLLAPGGFPLGGIDGLSARGRTLVGVQNSLGAPRIVRFDVAPSARAVLRAEVLEAGSPLCRIPTTGAFRGDECLEIGNSFLDARRDGEVTPEGRVATRLHRPRIPSRSRSIRLRRARRRARTGPRRRNLSRTEESSTGRETGTTQARRATKWQVFPPRRSVSTASTGTGLPSAASKIDWCVARVHSQCRSDGFAGRSRTTGQ